MSTRALKVPTRSDEEPARKDAEQRTVEELADLFKKMYGPALKELESK